MPYREERKEKYRKEWEKEHKISPETVKRWKEILAIWNSEEYNQSLHAEVDKYVKDGYTMPKPRFIKSMLLSVLYLVLSISLVVGFIALGVCDLVLWNGVTFVIFFILAIGSVGLVLKALANLIEAWAKTNITHDKKTIYGIVEEQKKKEFGIALPEEEHKLFIEWHNNGDKKLVWYDIPIIDGRPYEPPELEPKEQPQPQPQIVYIEKPAEPKKTGQGGQYGDPTLCLICARRGSCNKVFCKGFYAERKR